MTVAKRPTGIPGFDDVTEGGLPVDRVTLLAGTSGSAKTVFTGQFLAEGIRRFDEPGVFVTFEEPPDDLRGNLGGFGWPLEEWERTGRWVFVDAAPAPHEHDLVVGDYDFGGLMARIEHAVHRIGARRVVLDSLSAVFATYADAGRVRTELRRLVSLLRQLAVTAVVTAERVDEYGPIARYGTEEFVADNVVLLRNVLDDERRRRTVEVLKLRGSAHRKGEFPFTVVDGEGIMVVPLSSLELTQRSTDLRITSGSDELDVMLGGGYFRDSIVLASGATGTGKTLLVTTFLAGGARSGERTLLFAFEESREQLFRNASGWGVDFAAMEASGHLRVVSVYPELMGLEDHLVRMQDELAGFAPHRFAVDSLSALERVASERGYREFVIGLSSLAKERQMCALLTSTTPSLLGGTSITEAHISTITDTIVLLRYVELHGRMHRGLTVLKMRGSPHDREIREFLIDGSGIHIGEAFRGVNGILSGHFSVGRDELDRLEQMFPEA